MSGNDVQKHLSVLGISHASTKEEIKAAYHRQAKLWHPDLCAPDLSNGAGGSLGTQLLRQHRSCLQGSVAGKWSHAHMPQVLQLVCSTLRALI